MSIQSEPASQGEVKLTTDQAQEWYPGDDPIHGFEHVLRVLATAEQLAAREGADLDIVRHAVLLHDAAPEQVDRDGHHLASAEFAGEILTRLGWAQEHVAAVQHCIRAHRFRDASEQPQTLEARILFDADKLDAIGAIGVARAIAYAARAGQPFYAQPSAGFIETGQLDFGEPHSAYHEHVFKLRRLRERLYTASALEMADGRHQYMEQYFRRLTEELDGKV